MSVRIGSRDVGLHHPVFFVAEIGANHDGSLERAKLLIRLAKQAGADAVKFQNFRAPRIVSKLGFEAMGKQVSHQAKWKKSVYDVYEEASTPWEWTPKLAELCHELNIEYFSTPYDLEAVDALDEYVNLFKIGSGDITWPEMLRKVAGKGKPVILSTGASDIGECERAVSTIRELNSQIVLLQCNTNYTGDPKNLSYSNLNVLRTFSVMFPELVLGLSDHTPGHSAVLGAVALGARVIEKHFTDDNKRVGPDHAFAMTPATWSEMVARTRELESALGSFEKFVAENEKETAIVQRRSLRAARPLKKGEIIASDSVEALRPAPSDSIAPYELGRVLGLRARRDLQKGENLTWDALERV